MTAHRNHVPDQDKDAGDRREPQVAAVVVEVFVYVVVLSLFVEYPLPQGWIDDPARCHTAGAGTEQGLLP